MKLEKGPRAYRLCTQELIDTTHLRMNGAWNLIWKIKIPAKVKNFIWRICRRCIPTRVRLRDKGVNCTTNCVLCDSNDEDSKHLFFTCPSSLNVWSMSNFFPSVTAAINSASDATALIFQLLHCLTSIESSTFACILSSIWKQRNNKLWNNTIDAQNFVYMRAINLLDEWQLVREATDSASVCRYDAQVIKWTRPATGRVKCNIDASFSSQNNKVGIGMCIRDEFGAFVLARYDQFTPVCAVHIGEALGLLSALAWVHELNLGPVDFELDSKKVVDLFHARTQDATEFGVIITHCKSLYSNFYSNSSVEFVRRQAKEVAHSLAKAATFSASPQIIVDIPHCIEHILINDML